MLKIMIADSSNDLYLESLSLLKENYEYKVVSNGMDCWEQLQKEKVDILIIDLFLSQLDGADLIKRIRKEGNTDLKIICIAPYMSETISYLLSIYRVDYFLLKPFSLESLSEKLKLLEKVELTDSLKDQNVGKNLREIGMQTSSQGYQYLKTAITKASQDKKMLERITKSLYPYVATYHHTTASRVERCIRHTIEVTFTRSSSDVLYDVFGHTIDPLKAKPTNSEFISFMVDYSQINL